MTWRLVNSGCQGCNATGKVTCYNCGGKGGVVSSIPGASWVCEDCGGWGTEECTKCGGTGETAIWIEVPDTEVI